MKELKELIDDMYFDWDRLSSSGKETLNKISEANSESVKKKVAALEKEKMKIVNLQKGVKKSELSFDKVNNESIKTIPLSIRESE